MFYSLLARLVGRGRTTVSRRAQSTKRTLSKDCIGLTLECLEDRVVPSGIQAFNFPADGSTAGGVYTYQAAGNNLGFIRINQANASVLATNDGIGHTEIAAAFPGYGTMVYSNLTDMWTPLNSAAATALAVDGNGDVFASFSAPYNIIMEYKGNGLGVTMTNGSVINNANATSLAVDGADDLFAAFPSYGVMEHASIYAGTSGWTSLAGNTNGATVVAVNSPVGTYPGISGIPYGLTVAAMMPGFGVELYTAATGQWVLINPNVATALAVDAGGDVYGAFTGMGLVEFSATLGTSVTLDSSNVSGLAMDSFDNYVFVQYPGYGLFQYAAGTNLVTMVTLDNLTDLSDGVGILPGSGVYQYSLTGGWTLLGAGNYTNLATGPNNEVVAESPGNGVFLYTNSTGWTQVNPADADALAIDISGDVFASFAGPYNCVLEYNGYSNGIVSTKPGVINQANATDLTVDTAGNLYGAFPGYGVLEYAHGGTMWTLLNSANASLLSAYGNGEVVAEFPGYGLQEYTSSSGWSVLSSGDASAVTFDNYGDVIAQFPQYLVNYQAPATQPIYPVVVPPDSILVSPVVTYTVTAESPAVMGGVVVATPNGAAALILHRDSSGNVFAAFPGVSGAYYQFIGYFTLATGAEGDASAVG